MNRIIVNGEDLDMYPDDNVNLNIRVNDLDDISTRNSTFSNTVKIPATDKNKRIFNYLGVIGNQSRKPYEKIRCHYISNDLPLINDGYLQIKTTTNKEFSIVLFDGVIDLGEVINGLNIGDLDIITSFNHTRTEALVVDSLDNTSGYTYALAYYVENSTPFNKITVSEMLPMIFVKTVLASIITEAGYTYSGGIFDNVDFAKEVFTMQEGVESAEDASGDVIDFSLIIPKISQADFIKDVLNRYGIIIRLIDDNVEFAYLEDILAGEYGFVDWTYKLNEIKSEKYNTSYAQNNQFTFDYNDKANTDGDGTLYVVNDTLKLSKNVYKSVFDFNNSKSSFNIAEFAHTIPLLEYKEEDGNQILTPKKFKSCLYKTDATGGNFQIRLHQYDLYSTETGNEVLATTTGCSWVEYLNDKYPRFQNVLNSYKTIIADVNLTPIDIHNLDLFKIYYLSQTGQYYYVNSVKTNSHNSTVELTQINELLEDKGFLSTPNDAELNITSISSSCFVRELDISFRLLVNVTYETNGYLPQNLFVIINRLSEEDGVVIQSITEQINLNNSVYQYSEFNAVGSSWYTFKLYDPQYNIYSELEDVFVDCGLVVEPYGAFVTVDNFDGVDNDVPFYRDINYTFEGLSATTGTLIVQGKDINDDTNVGSPSSVALTEFTNSITHTLLDVEIPNGAGYYNIKLLTDIVTYNFNTFIT